jgi:S-adenosylmethionine decarboxylase proenzyme
MAPTLLASPSPCKGGGFFRKNDLEHLPNKRDTQTPTPGVRASSLLFLGFVFGVVCNKGLTFVGGGISAMAPRSAVLLPSQFLGPRAAEAIPSQNVSTEMSELQMDVYGLPSDFLDSTQQVHTLMETAIRQMESVSILQMMTYHFQPIGLTSLWLLSASHASIHTWPDKGFAAIDILTCGTTDLSRLSDVFKELFQQIDEDITFQFSLGSRGQQKYRPVNDLAVQMAQLQQEKNVRFRGKSKYQSIDVVDVQGTSWVDGDHEHTARRLYLDGVLQLSSDDEDVYHETFIHPAMLAHKGPERVVIMGGGDGGALSNVLMHRSVKSATLVEIDEKVVNVSKDMFPEFRYSFHDPRAKIDIADAFLWIETYSHEHSGSLDALFFDLLDINVPSPLLDMLFIGDRLGHFIRDTKTALQSDGFAVFQLGEKRITDECGTLGGFNDGCVGAQGQFDFVQKLKNSFKHVSLYSQQVPSFLGTWLFAIATDDAALFERWGRGESEIDSDIVERLNHNQELSFFSGSMMQQLRFEPDIAPVAIPYFEATMHTEQERVVSCPDLQPARPNSRFPGYTIPYMVANSKQGYGVGVYALRAVRRGEVIWRFHNESFVEMKPENWREAVEKHPYTKEHGIVAFLEKDWINEYPSPDGTVRMFLQLDDARFTNHGYTSASAHKFLQTLEQEGASEASLDEYQYGRAIIAHRDIAACEEILESYESSSEFIEDSPEADSTPEWWVNVLKAHGLTNKLDFPPSQSDFPSWAWLGKPSNSD